MNTVEIYVEEVHKEQPYSKSWTKHFPDKQFVEVEITTNCYGSKNRETRVFNTEEWEEIQQKGYYMG